MTAPVSIRPAAHGDAADITVLTDIASGGQAAHLWRGMAVPPQSSLEVGRTRALRSDGAFTWRRGWMAASGGSVAGMLIGYRLEGGGQDRDGVPPVFHPLLELEALVPGYWYVNVFAVYPEARGQGIGGRLLSHADAVGRDTGSAGMALIVADTNAGARRLYERRGYTEVASRRAVRLPDLPGPRDWLLLTKPHG